MSTLGVTPFDDVRSATVVRDVKTTEIFDLNDDITAHVNQMDGCDVFVIQSYFPIGDDMVEGYQIAFGREGVISALEKLNNEDYSDQKIYTTYK